MPSERAQIISFDVLMFVAVLLSLLALVPPFFSRRIVRRKTWHTVILSALVFAISGVLLVGQQESGKIPNKDLCLVQVALIHAAPSLSAVAMASYTIDIYISIRQMFTSDDLDGSEPKSAIFLILVPWLVFFLVFLEAIILVGQPWLSSQAVRGTGDSFGLYCRTSNKASVFVTATTVILALGATIACQVATGILLHTNWISVKKISLKATARKYFQAFVRTLVFTGIAMIGIVLGLVAISTTEEQLFGFSILLPFLPISIALIFGTYRDILSFYSGAD